MPDDPVIDHDGDGAGSQPQDPVDALAAQFLADFAQGLSPRVDDYVGRLHSEPERVRFRQQMAAVRRAMALLPEAASDSGAGGQSPKAVTPEVPGSAARRRKAAAAAPELAGAGDVVGEYTLDHRVGAGGMGEVWFARHRQHGRPAAVKLIFHDTYGDSAPSGLAQEFRMLVQLRHDHIVDVVDAGVHQGRAQLLLPYVVMDYLPATRSLTGYAAEHHLDLRARLQLFRDVCSAVAYVHEHGLVHLDIKPANLLVDAAGKVFLTDFGLARPVLGWFLEHVGGTKPYMSPEHLVGDVDRIGKRADVWSLGAVLFELLTGTDATGLAADAPLEQRLAAVRRPPRALAAADPGLVARAPATHAALERIVQRCLDPDPDRRFHDAGQLHDAIRDVCEARGLLAGMARWRDRRPKAWGVSVLAGIALVASGFAIPLTQPILSALGVSLEWYARLLPAPRESLAGLASLPDVVVVGFDTNSAKRIVEKNYLPDFHPDASRLSYRPLHAVMITRLADAGVRAIAFDVFFTKESEHDAMLAVAIRAAHARGTRVVLGVREWRAASGQPEMLSPVLWNAGPLWGGVTVGQYGGHYWADLLVLRKDVAPMPSLAMAAYAAFRRPQTYHAYHLHDRELQIQHYTTAGDRPEPILQGPEDWLRLDDVRPYQPDGKSAGLELGDVEAICILRLPSIEALAASTVRYEDLLPLPADALRRRVAGKIAVVADLENDEKIEGIQAALVHACAMQSLILAHNSRVVDAWNVPLALLGACLGAAVVWWLARRDGHRTWPLAQRVVLVALAWVSATAVLFTVAWYARLSTGSWLDPIPGIAAAPLAAILALICSRSRWCRRVDPLPAAGPVHK